MSKKVYLVALGCPKNLVDAEVMLGGLEEQGYQVVTAPDEADLLVVNSCAFIQPAVEESIDAILEMAAVKKKEPGRRLVVTGCLPQRYGRDLAAELPEVDLFVGPDRTAELPRLLAPAAAEHGCLILGDGTSLMDSASPRRLTTPRHRAYLKVTEGCSNRCSYCLIPSIRGRLRSRPLADCVAEAQRLGAAGVQELTLIAQDLTAYGLDLGQGSDLVALLAALVQETTIPWLRLLYLHPARVDRRLLELIAAEPRILPYLDIPLQHASDRILKAMNRGYGRERIDRLFGLIAEILPEAAIRTTFMVGFPGEDAAAFAELTDFVTSGRLAHLGVFPYHNEAGCAAAGMKPRVSARVKASRRARLMAIQQPIAQAFHQAQVGRTLSVLVEGTSRETELLLEGRAWLQAPDIDGCVYINAGIATPGSFTPVRITEALAYDLVGEALGTAEGED
ncbi:MAG: 30S ribosomal protein S12 methylthiotransferase RimO [Thermodesulfobacteriota bacterium]